MPVSDHSQDSEDGHTSSNESASEEVNENLEEEDGM